MCTRAYALCTYVRTIFSRQNFEISIFIRQCHCRHQQQTMKLYILFLFLLPSLVRLEDKNSTCLSCAKDDDCGIVGATCIETQCTSENGLFPNDCLCKADEECTSGSCHRVCEGNQGINTTCTEDSDCIQGNCTLQAVCVVESETPTPSIEPSKSEDRIMPFWMAAIVTIALLGGFGVCCFLTRKESCYECCCDGMLSCCCLICDAC